MKNKYFDAPYHYKGNFRFNHTIRYIAWMNQTASIEAASMLCTDNVFEIMKSCPNIKFEKDYPNSGYQDIQSIKSISIESGYPLFDTPKINQKSLCYKAREKEEIYQPKIEGVCNINECKI